MANKEALRELQSRLAEKLRAARTQQAGRAWLAVECAAQGFLFPLTEAGEIVAATRVVPVPHAKAWFVGVANLRGQLHGVVDLASFLGLTSLDSAVGLRETATLVAFNPSLDINAALLVDRLAGLRREAEMTPVAIGSGASAEARPRFAGGLWHDASGRVWQELSLAALATSAAFLAIVA